MNRSDPQSRHFLRMTIGVISRLFFRGIPLMPPEEAYTIMPTVSKAGRNSACPCL